MRSFSIIIPVFNRPDEVRELLLTLSNQTFKDFEVIIVEDGSSIPCEEEIKSYLKILNIRYFFKPNEGPGQTRNFGIKNAAGDYFIFFDSDCLIPESYMSTVSKYLSTHNTDAFGGPDAAHPSFTPIQKAISYSMTSFLTTGGIRGGNKKVDKFHPRSFNMGFSKEVYEATKGFAPMRFGEDVDLSLRILEKGFKTELIQDAFVYHKRRTDFKKFFKQVHNSGIARINLTLRHPGTLKLVHFFPALFTIYFIISIITGVMASLTGSITLWVFPDFLLVYLLTIVLENIFRGNNMDVSMLSAVAAIVQHVGYGTGFLKAFWKRIILGKGEFEAYKENFYK